MSDTNDVFQVEYLPKQKESMEDTCVCCGEYVPEGRMVCYSCEKLPYSGEHTMNHLQTQITQIKKAVQKLKETINAWDKTTWFECPRCGSTRDALTTITKIISWAEQMTNCPLKLDKQVPQKVKKYKGLNETACPNCRFVFGDYEYDDEKFDYCYNCGQRLSWESEVEHDA